MDIIEYNYYNDSASYKKEFEDLILKTVNTNSIIKVYIRSGETRKHFHEWAELNNLFHVSYCDKERDFETNVSYWCDNCKQYIKKNDYEIVHCCGDGQCGEYLITCNLCADDDDVEIIADECGAYNDTPQKETKRTNNVIVIANKVELLSDIFKHKNIKKPLEWIKKRKF